MPNTRYNSASNTETSKSFQIDSRMVLFLIFGLLAFITIVAWQYKQLQEMKGMLSKAHNQIRFNSSELGILRTISPYQFEQSKIDLESVDLGDLAPGWVTRIYEIPNEPGDINTSIDMGSFILDQTKFTLATHQNYGLHTKENMLYRLNGILPSRNEGRFQVGIEFSYENTSKDFVRNPTASVSCFARVHINNQNVIENRVRFVSSQSMEKLLTGDIYVKRGLHPITVLVHCDDDETDGESVGISLSFREPGSSNFVKSMYSIFHIYRPHKRENIL